MNSARNENKSERIFPLHPYLIALHGVAFMYAENYNDTYLNDAISTAAALLAATAALHVCLFLAVKSWRKSALLLSVAAFALTLPGGQLLHAAFASGGKTLAAVAAFAICAASGAAAFAVLRSKSTLATATLALNIAVAAALVAPFMQITRAAHAYGKFNYYRLPNAAAFKSTAIPAPETAPDIYYIIFDRYSAAQTQKQYFGRDGFKQYDALRERGFFVAGRSLANYAGTPFSLDSSMNMRYLDKVRPHADMYSEIEASDAARFLARRGYRYYNLGTFFEGTARSRAADENRNTWLYARMNPLAVELFKATTLHIILSETTKSGRDLLRENDEKRIAMLTGELPASRTRKFVFAHFLLPHEPFIYKADGSPRAAGDVEPQPSMYIDQLAYTDSVMLKIADALTKHSANPAVVIFQSDEGCTSIGEDIRGRPFTTDETDVARARILNAIYLPGASHETRAKWLRDDMSPVNTFRIIFNIYFYAGFDVLPDMSFITAPAPGGGAHFKDVTRVAAYQRRNTRGVYIDK